MSNPEVTVDKQTKIVLFYFVYVKFEWSVFYHDFVGKTEKHEFRSCMVAVVRKMEARVFNLWTFCEFICFFHRTISLSCGTGQAWASLLVC